MQVSEPPTPPRAQDLANQIRVQVREQVEAARQAALDAAADRTGVQPDVTAPEAITTVPSQIPDIPPFAADVARDVSMMFFIFIFAIVVGWPIARAISRWLDRRGQPPARLSPELAAQLTQLSQSVEAIAIEVERISEGQRFTTKLLTDIQSRRGSLLAAEAPEQRQQ